MKIPGSMYDANVYFSEMSVIWGQTKISWSRHNLNVPMKGLKAFGSNIFDTARGQRADRLQWLDHCKKILERRKRNQLLFSHCWPEFELGSHVVKFAAKVHRKTCFSGFFGWVRCGNLAWCCSKKSSPTPSRMLLSPRTMASFVAVSGKSEQLKPRRSGKFMPLHSKKACVFFSKDWILQLFKKIKEKFLKMRERVFGTPCSSWGYQIFKGTISILSHMSTYVVLIWRVLYDPLLLRDAHVAFWVFPFDILFDTLKPFAFILSGNMWVFSTPICRWRVPPF